MRHGQYDTIDGRPALRFERRLAHPVERVWRAITEPADLAQWFPDEMQADLRPGGAVRFESAAAGTSEGRVLELDPPRRLSFSWYANELRFELEPDGDGTLLRLSTLLEDRDTAARDAAGWHVCLDRLEQAVATGDAEAPGDRPTPEWRALYDEYVERGVPEGAPIPGAG